MENWIFFLFFGFFVALFLFRIVRHGGFKASMFGARISGTVGEVEVKKRGLMQQRLRVHVLNKKETMEHDVGLEISQSAMLSWSMTPVTLSLDEARRLTDLLTEAIRERA